MNRFIFIIYIYIFCLGKINLLIDNKFSLKFNILILKYNILNLIFLYDFKKEVLGKVVILRKLKIMLFILFRNIIS